MKTSKSPLLGRKLAVKVVQLSSSNVQLYICTALFGEFIWGYMGEFIWGYMTVIVIV